MKRLARRLILVVVLAPLGGCHEFTEFGLALLSAATSAGDYSSGGGSRCDSPCVSDSRSDCDGRHRSRGRR